MILSECSKESPYLTSNILGKVFLITGGAVGVGFETAGLLYSKDGIVFIAGRSKSNGEAAIAKIRQLYPASKGQLNFLSLDLGDLTTIKPAVLDFKAQVKRLDVLWNNAGVMVPPAGSKTAQVRYHMINT